MSKWRHSDIGWGEEEAWTRTLWNSSRDAVSIFSERSVKIGEVSTESLFLQITTTKKMVSSIKKDQDPEMLTIDFLHFQVKAQVFSCNSKQIRKSLANISSEIFSFWSAD